MNEEVLPVATGTGPGPGTGTTGVPPTTGIGTGGTGTTGIGTGTGTVYREGLWALGLGPHRTRAWPRRASSRRDVQNSTRAPRRAGF